MGLPGVWSRQVDPKLLAAITDFPDQGVALVSALLNKDVRCRREWHASSSAYAGEAFQTSSYWHRGRPAKPLIVANEVTRLPIFRSPDTIPHGTLRRPLPRFILCVKG